MTGVLGPMSFTSGIGANVYALTGSITKATMTDANPTVEETEVFSSRDSNLGFQVVAMSPDGSNVRVLASNYVALYLAVSTTYVYALNQSTSAIDRIPYGGGSPVTMKANVTSFALSPDGTKILYKNFSNELRFCNADGSGDTLLTVGTADHRILGFMSGTKGLLADNPGNVYSIVLSAGSSPNLVTQYAGLSVAGIDANSRRAVWCDGTTLHSSILTTSGSFSDLFSTGAPLARGLGVAPDGKSFVLAHGAAIDTLEVWAQNLSGATTIGEDFYYHAAAWGPYMTTRQVLPSGTFATAGAAILFSETGTTIPAVVLADATTRTTMAATRVSIDGAVNTTYRLDCDQLTKLFYSKGANYALTQVVNSISGLKGAFVSFDATTGLLSSVVTFAKRPTLSRRAGQLVLEGEGLSAIDVRSPKRAALMTTRFVIPQ